MEGPSNPMMDGLADIRQQFQLIQAQLMATNKELADVMKKGSDQAFTKTWQESATPESQDPIGRVVAVLERTKIEDSQEYYVTLLKAEKAAGRATMTIHAELSMAEAAYKKKLQNFNSCAPYYDGNPSKV